MSFQITQTCFNESDYVTLHSIKNTTIENIAKMMHKKPQQQFQAITGTVISGNCHKTFITSSL